MTVGAAVERVLPMGVRLEFVHVLVHRLASAHDCRVLHIKGVPAALQLGLTGRRPVDVDVWVAPVDADRLIGALAEAGWILDEAGPTTALYRHAAVLNHPGWGCSIDVHHRFPGIGLDADRAFDLAWSARSSLLLGRRPVTVPDRSLQALLVLLHAVRGLGTLRAAEDVRQVRSIPDPAEHLRIEAWAELLACPHATLSALPLSATDGQVGTPGRPRTAALSLWLGRLGRERSWWRRVRLLRAALLPDSHVMSSRAGRPLTGPRLLLEWLGRWRTGLADLFCLPWTRRSGSLGGATPGRVPASPPGWPSPATAGSWAPPGWSYSPTVDSAEDRLAWSQQGGTTFVADLDTARIQALNPSAALVWHVTRSLTAHGEEQVADLAVARITAGLTGAGAGLDREVRVALAELRSAGLLDRAGGS